MLDWIFEGIATWISSVISDLMDAMSGLFLGALGTDMDVMEGYFPYVKEAFSIFQYIAWALLLLMLVWNLFKNFGAPVAEAENPVHLLARSGLFALLIGYAKPIFLLALDIARAPYTSLMEQTMDPGNFTFAGIEAVLNNGLVTVIGAVSIVRLLLMIIMLIALGWNYAKLLLECVERYVMVGVLCYTSPLAYCMGGSKATSAVFRSWCRMVGSQLLLLILNVWFLRAFNSSVGQFVGNGGALPGGQGSIFLWLFCALSFLRIAQKADSYLAAMGLNVAQTGGSMAMEMLMAARLISGVTGGVAHSAGSVFRGSGAAATAGATSTGFMAGFASRFKPSSFVRDAVTNGGTRMGAGGTVGFVGRTLGGMAARNGALLSSESIGSVAARPAAVSGSIAGEIADRSLGRYMPHLQRQALSNTHISGGKITTTATSAGKESQVEMYSASQFEKPSVPHAQITAQDGSQWYQLAYGSGASEFYTPAALANVGMGEHLSQEQALASFPGISEQTSLRSVGMPQDGVLEANHPDYGSSLWYNGALYEQPDAPHETVQAANGVDWYAMQPHNDIPQFDPPTAVQAFNQAQFQSYMPGYEQRAVSVDTAHAKDGILEIRHEDGSAMRFYDHTQYRAPQGDYAVYADGQGGQWYAVPGIPTVERRPVYQDGKPIYENGQIKVAQVETIRYKTSLTRFAEPKKRTPERQAPRKK